MRTSGWTGSTTAPGGERRVDRGAGLRRRRTVHAGPRLRLEPDQTPRRRCCRPSPSPTSATGADSSSSGGASGARAPVGRAERGPGAPSAHQRQHAAHARGQVLPGAFIASLAIPWGNSRNDSDRGGYHLVWTRDLCQVATGLLAVDHPEAALRSLLYLAASQRPDGSFPQNFWLNGDPYWSGLQGSTRSPSRSAPAGRLRESGALAGFDPYPMARRPPGSSSSSARRPDRSAGRRSGAIPLDARRAHRRAVRGGWLGPGPLRAPSRHLPRGVCRLPRGTPRGLDGDLERHRTSRSALPFRAGAPHRPPPTSPRPRTWSTRSEFLANQAPGATNRFPPGRSSTRGSSSSPGTACAGPDDLADPGLRGGRGPRASGPDRRRPRVAPVLPRRLRTGATTAVPRRMGNGPRLAAD